MDLRARARLVAVAAAVGLAAGVGAFVVALQVVDGPRLAESKSFALGALLFGFGLLGWSSSIMLGDAIEHAQEHLGTASDWTEAKSRRAMARVTGFGVGWMLGVSLVAAVVR